MDRSMAEIVIKLEETTLQAKCNMILLEELNQILYSLYYASRSFFASPYFSLMLLMFSDTCHTWPKKHLQYFLIFL